MVYLGRLEYKYFSQIYCTLCLDCNLQYIIRNASVFRRCDILEGFRSMNRQDEVNLFYRKLGQVRS